ncbi:type II secretion system protein [Thalassolituus sp. LLYu03]|uniref:type II secretion system protein n=1 Tax=Thalassolituus sp. LLYu03 TaxID=3421656 RepID=UPI003D267A52
MKQGNFNQQAGFTLIELIMVIVILGILSAFALPRFADLGGEARASSIQAASGAIRSAANIAHAQWLANGSTGNVDLEGVTITMTTAGYPEADSNAVTTATTTFGIVEAAQVSGSDYGLAVAAGVLTVSLGTCSFTYTQTTGAVSTTGITTSC